MEGSFVSNYNSLLIEMMHPNHFLRLGCLMLMAFLQAVAMAANLVPLEASLPDLTELNVEELLSFAWFPDFRLDEIYSLFVQDEITWLPEHWKLTLRDKPEHNPVTYIEWQPNAPLAWTPNAHLSFRTSVSRTMRTRNWWKQDGHYNAAIQPSNGGDAAKPANPATLIAVHSSQNLKSEYPLAYELGWRSKFKPFLECQATAIQREIFATVRWEF